MVGNHYDSRIAFFFREIHRLFYRFVECKELIDHSSRVIGMRGPIYLAPLYHQEETIFVFREQLYGFFRHFCNRRHLVSVPIYIIRQGSITQQCPHFSILVITEHRFLIVLDQGGAIAREMFFYIVGENTGAPSKHHVQILIRDLWREYLVVSPVVVVRREIGRGRVWKLAGDNNSDRFLFLYFRGL